MSSRPTRVLVAVAALGLACGGGMAGAAADGERGQAVSSGAETASAAEPSAGSPQSTAAGVWEYEVVRVHPHDPAAFTQGLFYRDGFLYEGTGRRGQSTLRKVRIETGEVVQSTALPATLFGEGIAPHGDRIYQLTWTAGVGFVWDRESFRPIGQFRQFTEGWGLTGDGEHLIMSDGSSRLYFLDPEDMSVTRTLEVRDAERPRDQINELEYVDGEIWANVWHSDHVLRISPRDGSVLGTIDFTGILDPAERRDPEAVLNGIAYDPPTGRVFVTGKLWPKLFEVRVRQP